MIIKMIVLKDSDILFPPLPSATGSCVMRRASCSSIQLKLNYSSKVL